MTSWLARPRWDEELMVSDPIAYWRASGFRASAAIAAASWNADRASA